ncbi:MAG TPA: helix-turn-helix transcriptional regulator [Polyangiaceae bacterium]|nr:helix-turn-helix transcriptional regulator [Polyangiaceae bacterium]
MGPLAERIAWILEHRGFKSRRALAQATGLSGAHIALVAKGERGLSARAAHSIATAAGVDLRWLVTGEGAPDGSPKEPTRPALAPDPCPRREQALTLLGGRVLPEVASALRLERPPDDLPLEDWLARAKELQRLVKAFGSP